MSGKVRNHEVVVTADASFNHYRPLLAADGDISPDSRWSSRGRNHYIMFDYGKPVTVDFARVLFHKAMERAYSFKIMVSDDGVDFINVLGTGNIFKSQTDQISGGDEVFYFPPVTATYFRLFMYGNDHPQEGDWNDIVEMRFGDGDNYRYVDKRTTAIDYNGSDPVYDTDWLYDSDPWFDSDPIIEEKTTDPVIEFSSDTDSETHSDVDTMGSDTDSIVETGSDLPIEFGSDSSIDTDSDSSVTTDSMEDSDTDGVYETDSSLDTGSIDEIDSDSYSEIDSDSQDSDSQDSDSQDSDSQDSDSKDSDSQDSDSVMDTDSTDSDVCGPDKEWIGTMCVPICKENQVLIDNLCVTCGNNTVAIDNQCVSKSEPTKKPRVIFMADIAIGDAAVNEDIYSQSGEELRSEILKLSDTHSQEVDDIQSLIRLLVYANELDIVGLIATNAVFKCDRGETSVIEEVVRRYGLVRDNLAIHIDNPDDYPSEEELQEVIFKGETEHCHTYDEDSEGSNHIVDVLKEDNDTPLWVLALGGTNTLTRALYRLKEIEQVSETKLDQIEQKLRFIEVIGQDTSGEWISENFPDLFYLRMTAQVYGFSELKPGVTYFTRHNAAQNGDLSCATTAWFESNVMNHSVLGEIYPYRRYYYEPDTAAFLYLIRNGLNDPDYPHYGSWGGRYTKNKVLNSGDSDQAETPAYVHIDETDTFVWNGQTFNDKYVALWRWRDDYQNDFAARMDWTVASRDEANHNPIVVVNGDNTKNIIRLNVEAGDTVQLDASASSDPDRDALSFQWWVYKEPGTYNGDIDILDSDGDRPAIVIPNDAAGTKIHVIVTVHDNGTPILSGYRRVVLTVQ